MSGLEILDAAIAIGYTAAAAIAGIAAFGVSVHQLRKPRHRRRRR